jgi:hypothetical protein
MSSRQLETWERRADAEAKRALVEARQRNESHIMMRARCPQCRGAGLTAAFDSPDKLECCLVCKGVGMAAFDWTRTEVPRPLRSDERRADETERAERNIASIERQKG